MKIWINADDFGWTESSTRAIIEALKKGWVTSTTVCVNGKYFNNAISFIKDFKFEQCIGIHFNLTEGKPLTEGIKKNPRFCKDGEFISLPNRIKPFTNNDKKDVYEELTAQAECYKSTSLPCNHTDSHHHIHNAIPIFPIYIKVIKEQGFNKVRIFRNAGKIFFLKKIIKNIYNRKINKLGYSYSDLFGSVQDYLDSEITSHDGIFEVMTHPDFHKDNQIIIDRDSSSEYEYPLGEALSILIQMINFRQDKIIHLNEK